MLPAFADCRVSGHCRFSLNPFSPRRSAVWRAGWRITGSPAAAWAGWAAVALSVPFYFHAFTVYPDGLGAVLVMTGAYALALPDRPRASRWRAAWHGAALALLPWLHTRYAVLAGTLGALILFRLWHNATRHPWTVSERVSGDASRSWSSRPSVPQDGCGSFTPSTASSTPLLRTPETRRASLSRAPRGVSGLLLDQQFGLLPNAPVTGRAQRDRRVVAGTPPACERTAARHGALHGGGRLLSNVVGWAQFARSVHCPGPAPVFGLCAAAQWGRTTAGGRGTFNVLLGASVALTLALTWVDRGALVYNFRDGFALWMDRAAPLVNLPRAVPSLFRNTASVTAMQAAVWQRPASCHGSCAVLSAAPQQPARTPMRHVGPGFSPAMGVIAQTAAVHYLSVVCARVHADGRCDAGVACRRRVVAGARYGLSGVARAAVVHGTVLQLPAMRHLPAREAFAGVPVPSAVRRDARPPEGLLFVGRDLPAGRYRVVAQGTPRSPEPLRLRSAVESRPFSGPRSTTRRPAPRRCDRSARRRAGADYQRRHCCGAWHPRGGAADSGVQPGSAPDIRATRGPLRRRAGVVPRRRCVGGAGRLVGARRRVGRRGRRSHAGERTAGIARSERGREEPRRAEGRPVEHLPGSRTRRRTPCHPSAPRSSASCGDERSRLSALRGR